MNRPRSNNLETILANRRSRILNSAKTIRNPRIEQAKDESVWVNTSMRRSSIARNSMQNGYIPAYLVISYDETSRVQRIDLNNLVYTFGRKDDNDIVLQCPEVSKNHGSIEKTQDGFFIKDVGSSNGIAVNGEQIGTHASLKLNDGDDISVGNVSLKFHEAQQITRQNWQTMIKNHPSLTHSINVDDPLVIAEAEQLLGDKENWPATKRRPSSDQNIYLKSTSAEKHLSLVTILPNEKKYQDQIKIRQEIDMEDSGDKDFAPLSKISDAEVLRNDYEKLRLAYELSKLAIGDIDTLCEKVLELTLNILPQVDRGVIFLVNEHKIAEPFAVRLHDGKKELEHVEIFSSETILKRVLYEGKCIISSDVLEDPSLRGQKSLKINSIRSVICVPLIAHGEVHGVLQLDSRNSNSGKAFVAKDIELVKTVCLQTAMALDNSKLISDIEREVSIRENLGRFLPPHVVDNIIETNGENSISKSGTQLEGTILFADIRGFTQLSEVSSPQEIVDLLNDFFERLVQIVFKYDGIVDKFIGDCLMASWGTLSHHTNPERNAVNAALEFQIAVDEMNKERINLNKKPITIGIGINTGPLVAGYIGSSQRLEYTCIGDTVNTSSRICSLANENEVLISESTLERVSDEFAVEYIGDKMFKGKKQAIRVYQVHAL